MERAANSLWNALRRLADPEKPLDLLVAVWPLIVGARVATHTEPVAWEEGRLKVAVGEPEWQQQLEAMTGELRRQINRWWGRPVVQEVSCVPGHVSMPPEWEPAKPSGMPAAPFSKNREARLAGILKDLEGPLAEISDTELRELVARFIERYLEGRRK